MATEEVTRDEAYLFDEEEVTLTCKWHCLLCGRHFADERSFKAHYDTPANFGGCHKPEDKEGKYAILVDKEGECRNWSPFAGRGDWRDTPRYDVRVYMSEDW